jgi:hypothetical protein
MIRNLLAAQIIVLASGASSCSGNGLPKSSATVTAPANRLVLTTADTQGQFDFAGDSTIAKGGSGLIDLHDCEPSKQKGFQIGFASHLVGKGTPDPTVIPPEVRSEAWLFDSAQHATEAFKAEVTCMVKDKSLTRVTQADGVDFSDNAETIIIDSATTEDVRLMWADTNVLALTSSVTTSFGNLGPTLDLARTQDGFFHK